MLARENAKEKGRVGVGIINKVTRMVIIKCVTTTALVKSY